MTGFDNGMVLALLRSTNNHLDHFNTLELTIVWTVALGSRVTLELTIVWTVATAICNVGVVHFRHDSRIHQLDHGKVGRNCHDPVQRHKNIMGIKDVHSEKN